MKSSIFILALLCSQSVWPQTASMNEVSATNVRAEELIKQGEHRAAIEMIQEHEDPKSWRSPFLLGTAHLMLGNLIEAAAELDRALTAEGQIAEIWVQRAIVAQEQENPESALRLLKVALDLNSDCVEAYLNAGYAYETLGRVSDARIAYAEYLRRSSGQIAHLEPRRDVVVRLSAAVAQ